MDEIKGLYAKLRTAVDKAKAQGLRIKPGVWGITAYDDRDKPDLYRWVKDDGSNCLCPFGAFLLGKRTNSDDLEEDAAYYLRLPYSQVIAFMRGFDGLPVTDEQHSDPTHYYRETNLIRAGIWEAYQAAYALGQRFRKEEGYAPA